MEALKLPGGIVLTGGASSLLGSSKLAQRNLRSTSETYIPEQMGMKSYLCNKYELIKYAARNLDDVHRIAQRVNQ